MAREKTRRRVVIMGAAGRDFHNFNVLYRHDPAVEVVAFTAAQIPGIGGRRYPASLAGARYPEGIPIVEETELEALCRREAVDEVDFAYSDVPYAQVMQAAARVLAAGADFVLPGPHRTMLPAPVPVIAVSAVRTGCGKSQVTRWLSRLLRGLNIRAAVIRHPMPYGDLEQQAVQRFTCRADLDTAACTLEEREEYEPHLEAGNLVFAGVDYARIAAAAAAAADLILWDGGNNDFPLVRPDLHLVLVDALRPGHETGYYPGEAVLRSADVVIVAKCDAATPPDVARVSKGTRSVNSHAPLVLGKSPVTLDHPEWVRGRRVLIVEDGPTLTHGGMPHGAGYVAARDAGAAEIVDPRPYAAPELQAVFARYPHIGPVLPAFGYLPEHREALARTIAAAAPDAVVAGTPINLGALIPVSCPVVRARYEFEEAGDPALAQIVTRFLKEHGRLSQAEDTALAVR